MAGNKLSKYLKGTLSSPEARKIVGGIDDDFADNLAKSNKKALGALGAGALGAGAAGTYMAMDDATKEEATDFLKKGSTPPPPPTPPSSGGIKLRSEKTTPPPPMDDKFKKSEVDFKAVVTDPIDQAEAYDILDDDFKKTLGKAQAAYERTKDTNAAKALYEGIIQGVGHIAAGVYGLRTGLNLGGLQFSKTDWDAKQKNAMLELQQAIDQAKDVRGVKGQKLERDYQRSLDVMKQNQQLNEQALGKAIANARFDDANKERKLRQSIENQRSISALREAALKGKNTPLVNKIKELEKLEKRLFDLNKAYGKKESDETLELLKTETQRYKNLSKDLGINADVYEPSDFAEEEGFLWNSSPSATKIEERRQARIGGESPTTASDEVWATIPGKGRYKYKRSQLDQVRKYYPNLEVEE
jgi:hypothetical protein